MSKARPTEPQTSGLGSAKSIQVFDSTAATMTVTALPPYERAFEVAHRALCLTEGGCGTSGTLFLRSLCRHEAAPRRHVLRSAR